MDMVSKLDGNGPSKPLARIALFLGGLMVSMAVVIVPWVGAAPAPTEFPAFGQLSQSPPSDSVAIPVPQDGSDGSVPLCPSHDPTVWHGLYDPVRNCHYTHEHHDNPNAANDIFGEPGAWYGTPGQTISYPFQTFSPAGQENDVKHNGYKWLIGRDLGCHPFGGATGCITDYRVEVHSLATASDAVVRFHSFQAEIRACAGGICGTIRHGGWHDYGHLALLTSDDGPEFCPPLVSNPVPFVCGSGPHRSHSSPQHFAGFANWYGNHQLLQVDLHLLEFGPIDPSDPNDQLFRCTNGQCTADSGSVANGSVERIENLFVGLDPNNPAIRAYMDSNGVVNFSGYTDRYGLKLADGCTSVGLDCVPLQISNLPAVAAYHWRPDLNDQGKQFDISPARTGQGSEEWVEYPN